MFDSWFLLHNIYPVYTCFPTHLWDKQPRIASKIYSISLNLTLIQRFQTQSWIPKFFAKKYYMFECEIGCIILNPARFGQLLEAWFFYGSLETIVLLCSAYVLLPSWSPRFDYGGEDFQRLRFRRTWHHVFWISSQDAWRLWNRLPVNWRIKRRISWLEDVWKCLNEG